MYSTLVDVYWDGVEWKVTALAQDRYLCIHIVLYRGALTKNPAFFFQAKKHSAWKEETAYSSRRVTYWIGWEMSVHICDETINKVLRITFPAWIESKYSMLSPWPIRYSPWETPFCRSAKRSLDIVSAPTSNGLSSSLFQTFSLPYLALHFPRRPLSLTTVLRRTWRWEFWLTD